MTTGRINQVTTFDGWVANRPGSLPRCSENCDLNKLFRQSVLEHKGLIITSFGSLGQLPSGQSFLLRLGGVDLGGNCRQTRTFNDVSHPWRIPKWLFRTLTKGPSIHQSRLLSGRLTTSFNSNGSSRLESIFGLYSTNVTDIDRKRVEPRARW